jgi:hypothetical protein
VTAAIGTLFGGVELLSIDRIRRDPRTQPRNHINHEVVERYRDAMEAGDAFPPVTVFFDGTDYWLADGWHRVCAALCLEWQAIAAEVRSGGLRDAEWHSFSVNSTHGYPRGKDDVGRILGRIFRDPVWAAKGLREISRHCSIPKSTVHRHHEKVVSSVPPGQMGMKPSMREVTRADGTTYEIETRNIGRQAAPEFIDNEATWHRPDAYREPGEETAHPEYRQMERDPRFAFEAFPPEHAAPGGKIRGLVGMLHDALKLSPGDAARAYPWWDARVEYRAQAIAVAEWLTQLAKELEQ